MCHHDVDQEVDWETDLSLFSFQEPLFYVSSSCSSFCWNPCYPCLPFSRSWSKGVYLQTLSLDLSLESRECLTFKPSPLQCLSHWWTSCGNNNNRFWCNETSDNELFKNTRGINQSINQWNMVKGRILCLVQTDLLQRRYLKLGSKQTKIVILEQSHSKEGHELWSAWLFLSKEWPWCPLTLNYCLVQLK